MPHRVEDAKLADREAVSFLARCEVSGTSLENRPAYVGDVDEAGTDD